MIEIIGRRGVVCYSLPSMGPRDDSACHPAGPLSDDSIAYAILRLTLGVNIFLHGLTRLSGDHAAFLAYLEKTLHQAPVPCRFSDGLRGSLALVRGRYRIFYFDWPVHARGADCRSATDDRPYVGHLPGSRLAHGGLQLIYGLLYFVLLTLRSRNLLSLDAWWMSGG